MADLSKIYNKIKNEFESTNDSNLSQIGKEVSSLKQKNDNYNKLSNSELLKTLFAKPSESVEEGDDPVVKKKYDNEFTKGRENWKQFLDMPVSGDNGKKLKDIIYSVSKKTGIRPEVLFTSAMEEGLQGAKTKDNKLEFDKDEEGSYIDSYKWLGIDNAGKMMDQLQKEGYIKDQIEYYPYERMNDSKTPYKVYPAHFNSLEDALTVKAAVFKKSRDNVEKYASKNNLKLSEDATDFLTMMAYNGGDGILPKAIKKYKELGTLDNESFLDNKPGDYANNQAYYHSRRRFDPMRQMREEKVFDDYYLQSSKGENKPTVSEEKSKADNATTVSQSEPTKDVATGRKIGEFDEYMEFGSGKKYVIKEGKRVYF